MANELVLIVEDDASSRKLARDLLAVNGYRTIECETGEEGFALPWSFIRLSFSWTFNCPESAESKP